ncbi:hypothetical protein NZK35_27185 [Stieleria sp. ICT_E10.1]|uniref:hypothetical protein n=1 Tax=Stieleria sedimenti TaxID=2976331 RepID=UPI00218069C9|nr:hypothetical protein [Stieleria sedimenti]MCS7470350.1 hypothetical protein [Stieleria sedimenti]
MPARLLTVLLVAFSLTATTLPAASPTGRWAGSWSSSSTGHHGPLRARIRAVDADTYRALFAGRFAKVIPFVYPAKLQRVPGTSNRYHSSTRLPLLGEYRMTATVTPHHFNATFRGKKDLGVFRMSRAAR